MGFPRWGAGHSLLCRFVCSAATTPIGFDRRACVAIRSVVAVSEVAAKALGPWLDVVIRLWLAQAFLTLEIATMMTGPGAESRANTGWSGLLHNLTTSGFAIAVQTLWAVLLLLGLFSRLAAGPMLVQSLFLQMRGAWSDIYLFWAALLGWLIVMGPGPFSLDRLLWRSAETSAVPGIAALRRAYSWVTIHLGPWYKLAIRVWLAAAPAGAAFAATGMSSAMQRGDIAAWLPHVPGMVALLPSSISLLLATLPCLASAQGSPHLRCSSWSPLVKSRCPSMIGCTGCCFLRRWHCMDRDGSHLMAGCADV